MRALRLALLALGMMILAMGLVQVITPRPVVERLWAVTPAIHAAYMGAETCYTCHPGMRRAFGGAMLPFEAAASVPHPALHPPPPPLPLDSGAVGQQTAVFANTMTNAAPGQRFVLQTERGYAILPEQWGMPAPDAAAQTAHGWVGGCAGCHVIEPQGTQAMLHGRDFTCETCHGPGGVHIKALVSLRTSRHLRGSLHPAVDVSLCRACHAWAAMP